MPGLPYRTSDSSASSNYTHQSEEDDEEEDETQDASFKTAKDAVLFAIDVSKSMLKSPSEFDLKKPETGLSPTVAALKCAYALMQQRIISNPNDMMGILLFGTEKSKFQEEIEEGGLAGKQYAHCYLLTDLDVPAASDIKLVRDIVQDEEEAAELLQASSEEVSMANVLFCANQIFTTKAPNFTSRRLFLVTDNDYPHANSRDSRNSAVVRAKDLYDLGVTIELFPISHPDRGYVFDRSKFYNDIVYSAVPSDPDATAPLYADIKTANSTANNGISLLQSLLSSVASRSAPRRALFSSVPFEIGPGLKISVKGFMILKKQDPKRTAYVYVPPDSEKAQIAVGSSNLSAGDTGRTVEKVEIRRAYKFGGESITFSDQELERITNFGEPVIRIIGFKPLSALPIWATLKQSTFIYPSEESFIGSTRIFSALHQKLLKSQKIGIAWFIARRNSGPRLVAAIPGSEERNQDGEQETPPGLWLKPLPFADDVRNPPETHLVRAPDYVTDAMRHVIQNLQLPKAIYDPHKYANPSLQWFFRILQALALEEDLPEQPEDKTLPRWKQIHKRAGGELADSEGDEEERTALTLYLGYVVQWGAEVDRAYNEWATANGDFLKAGSNRASKRTAASASAPRAKKVKDEDDEEGVTDAAIRSAYDQDTLSKFKVPELKTWCASKKIGKGLTKKADMIDAITSFFETKMEVDG